MKSMPNRNLLLFLSSVVLFFTACYQPKEGCLDINATNFDATADEECCCQYPVLQLKFKHFASGNEFSASDTILNDFGQQFRIPSFAFYFSDFEFTGTSGNKVQVSDTIRLPAPFDSIVLKKDIALVRAITSNALLGRFIQEESFTKLYFQVGVPSAADGAVLSKIPSTSELSAQPDNLYDATKAYVSVKYVFSTGIEQGSSERFIRIFQDIPFSFNIDLPLIRANNTCVTIVIDHAAVFHNVDVKNDNDETIKNKLVNNLQSAIVLIPCN